MKAKKTVFARIRSVASQVIFYLMLALILLAAVFLAVRGRGGSPTFVFGRTFLWVETGSMKPTIDERSYVAVRRADGQSIAVGDIIVFPCPDSDSPIYGSLVIHRVVEVSDEGYRTKGDNAQAIIDSWTVSPGDVVAVWERNLGVMTFFGRLLASKMGFIMLCAAFLAICSFVYIPSIIKTIRDEDTERSDTDQSGEAHEAEIRRRIELEVARLEREGRRKNAGADKNVKPDAADSGKPGADTDKNNEK